MENTKDPMDVLRKDDNDNCPEGNHVGCSLNNCECLCHSVGENMEGM